ncbi:MAG: choice-of-anchor D domain-containing protein [Fidelibacterota bacterium]
MLKNTILENNVSDGGAAIAAIGNPFIENVIIRNHSFENSYALIAPGSSISSIHFSNVLIYGNSVSNIFYPEVGVEVVLNNTTIVNNIITGNIFTISANPPPPSSVNIINSILWNNGNNTIDFVDEGNSVSISNSLIQGGQNSITNQTGNTVNWLNGNIDADPLFADTANNDYTLQMDSPCIDAGDPSSDLDPDGTVSDMGAFYYHQDGPARPREFITTPSADFIGLQWGAVNPQPENYVIYRSTNADDDFYTLSPFLTQNGNDTTYIDSSVIEDETYYYRISGIDAEQDEGLLAFTEHGRLSNDSTALDFVNSGDYVNIPNYPVTSLADILTVELWAKPRYTDNYFPYLRVLFERGGLVLMLNGQSEGVFVPVLGVGGGANLTGTTSLTDGGWHHFAIILNGPANVAQLWTDGHLEAEGTTGNNYTFGDLHIGRLENFFNGIIDEVRISDVVKYTESFIPPDEFILDTNTVALWHFNEGSMDAATPAIYDMSGNGHHGEIIGNPVWVDGPPFMTPDTANYLVINEIMQNPSEVSDPLGEWIEVHNRWFTPIHLEDFTLADDGADAHTISSDVIIPAGGYTVLGVNADTSTNGNVKVDYVFSGFSLGNSDDEVVIKLPGGTELDRVNYDNGATFPDPAGASMELIAPHFDNTIGSNWTMGVTPYGDGDLGSPGRRNDAFSGQIAVSDTTFLFDGIISGEYANDTLTIFNNGVRRLVVDSMTVSLPEYSLTPGSGFIEIGDSLVILITFTPNSSGFYRDTVRIYSDDPVNNVLELTLSGLGISDVADIVVFAENTDSLFTHSFSFTRVGSPRSFTFNVANIGAEDLEIDEISITGDNNAFFVNISSLNLELNDSASVIVTFDPPSNGTYSGTLSLTSNDPDEALYNISFDGIASQYIIFFVPGEIATIQAALDSAMSGDTIHVATGSYGESLIFPENDLVLRGAGTDSTTLTGGDSSIVLTVNGGQSNATIISDLTIKKGSGTNGGGMVIDNGSNPQLKNILFYDNNANHGAAVYVDAFSGPFLDHITFVVNAASSSSGAGVTVAGGSSVSINNSIFWANTGTAIEVLSGSESTTYSIVEGGNAGTGNIDADPQFTAPASADFHLAWGSPAIDGGDPASDSDADGTLTDMGALFYDQSYQPPGSPVGLAYTPTVGEITLQWSANPEADVTDYIIYKGLATDQLDSIDIVAVPVTEYIDQNGDPSQIYYYQIAAMDTSNLISDRSEILVVSYPLITAETNEIDFGSVLFSEQEVKTIFIYNTGSATLGIDSIYVEDDAYFSVSSGGLLLSRRSSNKVNLDAGRRIQTIYRQNNGINLNHVELNSRFISENHSRTENDQNEVIHHVNVDESSTFQVPPGDSLEITITFASTDTGSFTTNLIVTSDDPIGNDMLTFGLTGNSVAPAIALTSTMSVVTYVNNDIPFTITVQNPGGWPLDYSVTAEADWFGYTWMDVSQPSGQIPVYSSGNLIVDITNTSSLDPGAFQGYIYFNTNSGMDPYQLVRTDTVSIYMALLADGSQISMGNTSVPSGNASPITVLDDVSQPIGLVLDFINSEGGNVTVTRIDAHPPSDATTPFIDPSTTITDPIYANRYYEISHDFSSSFTMDIGFDYNTLPGILDPSKLRLAKRTLNAGVGETWTIIPSSQTLIDETNKRVIAQNQTSFSQWAMLSNVGENTFTDAQAPVLQSITLNPIEPGILEAVTITAEIDDETGVESASLFYATGGEAQFDSLSMTDNSGSFAAEIPGSDVTKNGIVYFITMEDQLGYSAISDTTGFAVKFPANNLTTASAEGSAYPSGLPLEKWRLISIPAILDNPSVSGVIGDELGSQDNNTWRIFSYDITNQSYQDNPTNFTTGESYWIYQKVSDNLPVSTPAGQTGNMEGTDLTLEPGWSLIGSPYPFLVQLALDQGIFYGPITYGLNGESWSNVVTELSPWNGYPVYNRTANNQMVTIDPLPSSGTLVAKSAEKEGWSVQLMVESGEYKDEFNYFGVLADAKDGVDYFDNPEILPPGNFVNLSFNIESIEQFTSDFRQPGHDGVTTWDIEINNMGLSHNAIFTWEMDLPIPQGMISRVIDLQTRTVMKMENSGSHKLGRLNEQYARKLKAVAGSPDEVNEKVNEILASIPESFALHPNYPNPFNPVTNILFGLPEPRNIRLIVVNILGQEVVELTDGWHDLGFHTVQWNGLNQFGQNVSAGMYFAVLSDGKSVRVQKMLLLK